jgi:hypothetical protein
VFQSKLSQYQQVLSGKPESPSPGNHSLSKAFGGEATPTVPRWTEERPTEEEGNAVTQANSEVFETIIQIIIAQTGVDTSELTDDTVIADLGVDSFMTIEMASRLRTAQARSLRRLFYSSILHSPRSVTCDTILQRRRHPQPNPSLFLVRVVAAAAFPQSLHPTLSN